MERVSDERLREIISGHSGIVYLAPADHLSPEETIALATDLYAARRALAKIVRRAQRHDDDTFADVQRLLFHVHSIATAALRATQP